MVTEEEVPWLKCLRTYVVYIVPLNGADDEDMYDYSFAGLGR